MASLSRPKALGALTLVAVGGAAGAWLADRGLGVAGVLVAVAAGIAGAALAAQSATDALLLATRAAQKARAGERLPLLTPDVGMDGATLWEELDAVSEAARARVLPSALGSRIDAVTAALPGDAAAGELATAIEALGRSVTQTVETIGGMSTSIQEVARNIDALRFTAEETSTSMNEMDVAIGQVRENADTTARITEEVSLDAEQGAETIQRTVLEINHIKSTAEDTVGVIGRLGEKLTAIGKITKVIDEITERTNLLALNAAILAAQAGEHGRGFTVVAEEIKDLSERAAESTREIAELIEAVQAESRHAVASVERSKVTVDRGVEVSREADRALKRILERSRRSTTMVRAIAQATDEQARGSRQVTEAIHRMTETVQQIAAAAAQQARGSEQMQKAAEQTRALTVVVERGTRTQADGVTKLADSVASLKASHAEKPATTVG